MNPLALIFLVFGGIFALAAAIFDWDWFMNNRKARFIVNLLGRTGARVFYALLGVTLLTLGNLFVLGILK